MINLRTYPYILAITTVISADAFSIILTSFWPEICWLPRIGGILIGTSLYIHGYIHVNEEKFNAFWRWDLTRNQAYTHFANIAAIFGTILTTFGDLMPSALWATNSGCGISS
jgi:hypothetical protein